MPQVRLRGLLLVGVTAVAAAVGVGAARAQAPAPREVGALPSLAPLVESVKSAVINVDVQAKPGRRGGQRGGEEFGAPDELFERFFGRRPPAREREQLREGKGSGFIIDPNGLALTNNHVVEGAVNIRVTLDDGRKFDAEVVGRDPLTDIAVIRLKGKLERLPVVPLGDSDGMRVGDWVVAIGNPFGLASSVSAGIISARARNIGAGPFDEFLQTDAAINLGNSGGPLFNLRGEVIGINTAIVGHATGIGFAVPSNLAKALLPQLQKDGAVTRGWLGVGIQDLTPELAKALSVPLTEGALVTQVNDGSPAKKAGLQPDDTIVQIDDAKITSKEALTRVVALKRPGSTANVSLFRNGKQQTAKVVLGTRPDLEGVGGPGRGKSEDEEEGASKRIGLQLRDLDPQMARQLESPRGAVIVDVAPGSPAERAQLSAGMVITEVNKKPVTTSAEVLKALKGAKSGEVALLRVFLPQGQSKQLRAVTVP